MVEALALGLDFGTESCRAVLVNLDTGAEVGSHVGVYEHGVVDRVFPPTGRALPLNWAIQYPTDYLDSMVVCVRGVLDASGIDPQRVVAIGVDTTACTLVPVGEDDAALAGDPQWQGNPYAYAKLWKDHSSQPQADRINERASEVGERFVDYYGGKTSSEWVLAKTLKLYEDSPEVFDAAARIYECGDWLVSSLVGNETRGSVVVGYKASYQPALGGYPSSDFLDSLAPGFSQVVDKLGSTFVKPGECAGTLTREWADRLGLTEGVAVAASNLDAHVAVLGAGITAPNEMLLVMGTSVCNLMLADELRFVAGVAGVVEDGLVPGFWAYEAGQAGVGDTFGWFVKNLVPREIHSEAEKRGLSVFDVVEERAAALQPGGAGLVALDWFNGNRSTLMDAHLSGMVVGMTLQTTPEEIYRALVESAAFGQRTIIEAFRGAGVPVRRIVACGGLPAKAGLLMQTLADVLDMEIEVSSSVHTPAVGAALHAAIAGGKKVGGFDSFPEASRIASPIAKTYVPDPARRRQFDDLYRIYAHLYDLFGTSNAGIMHALREIAGRNDNNQ